MADYHVGCGIAGIYAGKLKKSGDEWLDKSDVTKEALNCVFDFLYSHEKEVRATIGGKRYVMQVVPIEESEEV